MAKYISKIEKIDFFPFKKIFYHFGKYRHDVEFAKWKNIFLGENKHKINFSKS
jgi:hypothetical protein